MTSLGDGSGASTTPAIADNLTRAALGRYLYGPPQRHWLGLVPRCVNWRIRESDIMQSR